MLKLYVEDVVSCFIQHLFQVNKMHLSMKDTRCVIDPDDVCGVCSKRIGNR